MEAQEENMGTDEWTDKDKKYYIFACLIKHDDQQAISVNWDKMAKKFHLNKITFGLQFFFLWYFA